MTVETTARKQSFAGGQSALTFTFRALTSAPEDIKVAVVTSGTQTLLTYSSDYTVTINTDGVGGTVHVSPSYSSAYTYTVYRETTNTQSSDYEDYNQFPSDTLEEDLDRRTLIQQEQGEDIVRSVKVQVSSTLTGSSLELPSPSGGAAIVWKNDGSGITNSTYASDTVAQTCALYATTASTQATLAGNYATTASGQATLAGNYATTASGQATLASNYASTASTQATLAGNYASTASTQATLAGNYASTASTEASTATTQASLAGNYASTASTQATLAGNYASTASTQATLAGNYATSASTSATEASNYATTASTQAGLAENYATTASTQATLAGNYATTCATIQADLGSQINVNNTGATTAIGATQSTTLAVSSSALFIYNSAAQTSSNVAMIYDANTASTQTMAKFVNAGSGGIIDGYCSKGAGDDFNLFSFRGSQTNFACVHRTIANGASLPLESNVGAFSFLGGIEIIDSSGGYALYYLKASSNETQEIIDVLGNYATSDSASHVCVIADGDSTYSIKNNLGSSHTFTLFFRGF